MLHPVSFPEALDRLNGGAANIRKGYLFLPPDDVLNNLNRAGYYRYSPGFFCEKELQIEKFTRVPLRLRLGSLADNNHLEGKPGW